MKMKAKVKDNKLIFEKSIFPDKASGEVECEFFEDKILIWLNRSNYQSQKQRKLCIGHLQCT